jgi:hypothetical protein
MDGIHPKMNIISNVPPLEKHSLRQMSFDNAHPIDANSPHVKKSVPIKAHIRIVFFIMFIGLS